MKKLLFISAAVLALASCQNDDSVVAMYNGVEVDTEAEILMQQAVIGSTMSKVGIEGKVFPTDTIFGTKVYYLKEKDWYDASAKLYIDDDSIAYDATISTFRHLNKHYYWPKSGKLTFFSYFPASLKDQVSIDTEGDNKGKYKVTGFVVTDGKTDLMLADIKKDMKANDTEKGVTTKFNHKLTKIGVRARLKNTVDTTAVKITIKKIEFVDALSKGTLTGVSASADGKWTKTDVRANYLYADTSIVLKRQNDEEPANPSWYEEMGKDQLILMPQDSAEMYTGVNQDSVALKVNYIYTMLGTETIDEENEKVINVATMANHKNWDINKYIVYRLEFDAEEILFDPSVVEFDDEEYVDHEIK
ncbi:MAG: fimbrillin family protein [Bacteroidaceae bacterium]|nr:fimbrillin family protein [Bacteroidaceae bacterium]